MSIILPPEWAKQSGVMLTWPHQETIWSTMLDEIDEVFANVATAISHYQKVLITCVNEERKKEIIALLKNKNAALKNIHIYQSLSDDIWVRDHGPITVRKDDQSILLDFIFNGWGNKYPAENDNKITRSLQQLKAFKNTAVKTIDMVLEGGAIETDGHGTLLTTRECLLAQNRNPHLTQQQIEEKLQNLFGIKKFLWLEHGKLAGDDTDGHIDTLARFMNPHTICYVACNDPQDEHYLPLKNMEAQLKTFTDYQGNAYRLVPLPWPRARYAKIDGRRLPATYANFLIINNAVLIPTYDDPADEIALTIFREHFPHHDIISIHSLPTIEWYGSLHCMTMQLPAGAL